jgi:hypothetical protein
MKDLLSRSQPRPCAAESGHFTCYKRRTFHMLLTKLNFMLDIKTRDHYNPTHEQIVA